MEESGEYKWIDRVSNEEVLIQATENNTIFNDLKEEGKLERTYYKRKGILTTIFEGTVKAKKKYCEVLK